MMDTTRNFIVRMNQIKLNIVFVLVAITELCLVSTANVVLAAAKEIIQRYPQNPKKKFHGDWI